MCHYRSITLENPHLTPHLTRRSVFNEARQLRVGARIQSVKPGCLYFTGLYLNYEGKQRQAILTVGIDSCYNLDKAFYTIHPW